MLFQRVNRTNPEKIFIVAFNSWSTASLTNGQAVIWDYTTDVDGVGVTKPTDGNLQAGHYGVAFAGIAAETIASGSYGLLQVYGYHSAVRVRTQTGTRPPGELSRDSSANNRSSIASPKLRIGRVPDHPFTPFPSALLPKGRRAYDRSGCAFPEFERSSETER